MASVLRADWTNVAEVALSGVKVTLSQPVCVTRSTNWLWFPAVYRTPANDLFALMSTAYDGDPDGTAMAVSWSQDGGLTWSAPAPAGILSYCTLTLTNGDVALLPYLPQLQGENDLVGPCGIVSNGTREITWVDNAVSVTGFPQLVRREALYGARFVFHGQTLRLTNGLYFATLYGWYEGVSKMSIVAAVSEDGFRWRVQSTVADYTCSLPGNEGPCETTTVRLPDGRLMNVFRLDSYVKYGQSWSSDEGLTWSTPVNTTGPFSVEPSMQALPSGMVALSGGRAGLFLWVNRAGDGVDWETVDIRAHHNQYVPGEPITVIQGWNHHTTAYTELARLDDEHLLYIYDRIPGGHNQLPPPGDSNSIWVVRAKIEKVALPPPIPVKHEGAQDPTTENPAWFVRYDNGGAAAGGTEPDGTAYWEISTAAEKYLQYGYNLTAPALQRNWLVRARLRVVTPTTSLFNAAVGLADGARLYWIGLRSDGLFYAAGPSFTQTSLKSFTVDTGRYYEIELKKDQATGNVTVFLDGEPVGAIAPGDVSETQERWVDWGDDTGGGGASAARWNSLQFYPSGRIWEGTMISIQ